MECYVGFLILCSLLYRFSVSLFPHSGYYNPPMYGDYEAQRHWMEITINLPTSQWYVNSSTNDLNYWGLDYPPLTAYHSWLCGRIAKSINEEWVDLFTSRGIETVSHKLFMRMTVFMADFLIYFSGIFAYILTKSLPVQRKCGIILLMLMYPGIVLIDHGHFQYNCISIGLFIWAVVLLENDFDVAGSMFFSLALNYKQMELYHALPFFCFIFGKIVFSKYGLVHKMIYFLKIASTVVFTFIICWLPFLQNSDSFFHVLGRIFPVQRGLFEDKVANFWCSISIFVKLKNIMTNNELIFLCLFTTCLLLIPSCLHLLTNSNIRTFKYALINSSMIFFLFSFHPHEKSILIPASSVCLLIYEIPFVCFWFLNITVFSMLPLLIKDGHAISSISSFVMYFILIDIIYSLGGDGIKEKCIWPKRILLKSLFILSIVGCIVLALLLFFVTPPQKLPDIYSFLIAFYCAFHFIIFTCYFHYCQLNSSSLIPVQNKKPVKKIKQLKTH